MGYIGVDINYGNLATQEGTGDGSDVTPITTLDYTVPSSASIMVTLDGVTQVPGVGKDFTASGTTLTFTTAPADLVKILVYFLGRSLDIGTPADDTVGLAQLSATGTPTASLALKGDNSWGTAGGTSLAGGMIRTNLLAISSPVTFAGTENGVTYGPISVTALVTVSSPSVWHIL